MDYKRLKFAADKLRTKLYRLAHRRKEGKDEIRYEIHKRIARLGKQYEDGNSNCIGYTYHPIPFEEFNRSSVHRGHDSCKTRLDAILSDSQVGKGDRVLDIGANVGYFSFGFSKLGAIVDSVELQRDTFEIGSLLSLLYDADVNYINKPVSIRLVKHLDHRYKVTLLLSVVHWILKQNGKANTLELLRYIDSVSDILYFEAPSSGNDALVFHEEFSSKRNLEAFLAEAFPERDISELGSSADWGGRVLYRIR